MRGFSGYATGGVTITVFIRAVNPRLAPQFHPFSRSIRVNKLMASKRPIRSIDGFIKLPSLLFSGVPKTLSDMLVTGRGASAT